MKDSNRKKVSYSYERPALTVDCVVFGYQEGALQLLLIRRKLPPFQGAWALPGGYVRMHETLEEAAKRELLEETSVKNLYLEQLYTFGALDRDPRERTVTVSYYALIKRDDHDALGGTDAEEARWFDIQQLPELAFDHDRIIATALKRLQGKITYEPIGFELLPEKFPFSALESLYMAILQRDLDRRNFRKKMLSFGIIKQLKEKQQNVPHKRGFLYSFDWKKYEQLQKRGMHFEL